MEFWKTKKRVPFILWIIPILICTILLLFADVFEIQSFSDRLTEQIFRNVAFEEHNLKGFSINTPGCKIPHLDPFDAHIKKFIVNATKPRCNNGKPALFASNLTSIYLLQPSLQEYNVTNTSDLKCCFEAFWRIEPTNVSRVDNKIQFSSTCQAFQDSADINDEFIRVYCIYDNTTIYSDTFSFVPLKNTTNLKPDPNRLNVLIVGLDGVSRLNFHRQMIKTANYLKEHEAVELLGYNKVGDNTFPNLMPVLAGMSEEELVASCWRSTADHFDDCPFIWKLYKQKGYTTVYGEDSSWMGVFNYQRNGFKKQPTDYAYNYFNRLSEKLIGNSHYMNVMQCVGSRLVYKDLLDYITKFVVTMDKNDLPYFGFFWGASLSHDNLNMPQIGDEDYVTFFKKLAEENRLKRTVLIFMSDHGIRWGEIRQTFQGRMEERLPFVFWLLPKFFNKKYSSAYQRLKMNTRRLTTPFDLHETLLDLLDPSSLLLEDNLVEKNLTRGVSLFKAISKKRTCEDAGISSHFCTCQESVEVNITSSLFDAAESVLEKINFQLIGYSQCAKLHLDSLINARLLKSNVSGSNDISDYMITLKVLPSEAIFEATVRYVNNGNGNGTKYEVIGSISRLNLYGKQSSCITDFHLKLYCYCKNILLSHL